MNKVILNEMEPVCLLKDCGPGLKICGSDLQSCGPALSLYQNCNKKKIQLIN